MMLNGKLGIFAEDELTKPERVVELSNEVRTTLGIIGPHGEAAFEALAAAEHSLIEARAAIEVARTELAIYWHNI